jgi:hypothetical protein
LSGIFAAGVLVAPLSASSLDDLQLVYLANFADGGLRGSVDKLRVGTLDPGSSEVYGSNPLYSAGDGTVVLTVTRPTGYSGTPVSSGLFATPVAFGPGSRVGLSATFIAPQGPHEAGDIWAATVGVRTGGVSDLGTEKRIAASLQVRGHGVRLNVPGANPAANLADLPQDVYDAIFDPTNPKPVTLELLIDRVTGAGVASLKVQGFELSKEFQSPLFPTNAGPTITAIGPSIAIASGSGKSASIKVREFRIFAAKN